MTLGELKDIVKDMPDDLEVKVCVETPGGWVCPDGATVDVKFATQGFDWHMGDFLIVPMNAIRVKNVDNWAHRVDDWGM